MTPAVLHVLLFCTAPHVDLDRLTPEAAAGLAGRPVWVSVLVAAPPYTWNNTTVVGGAGQPDQVERVVVKGKRLDVGMGKRVVVRAAVRVAEHRAAVVNGVFVPGWVEVRAEE